MMYIQVLTQIRRKLKQVDFIVNMDRNYKKLLRSFDKTIK